MGKKIGGKTAKGHEQGSSGSMKSNGTTQEGRTRIGKVTKKKERI